jgi:spermidine dehydrogenase
MSRSRSSAPGDRELGMQRAISRRDFVQGVAVGSAGLLAAAVLPGCAPSVAPLLPSPPGAQDLPGYYPPGRTGLRGSHPGSFEAAHALRDGAPQLRPVDLDEHYDLIVVGAGISGLSAAHFYREQNPTARILLLDNHDDFGGHAKRNEFDLGGQLGLMNGGTLSIESPRPYSTIADGVLRTLGIDTALLAKTIQHPEVYRGLGLDVGVFFDRETFGADHLAVGYATQPWQKFLAQAPLSAAAQRDLVRVETGNVDYLQGLSSDQKKQRLKTLSYRSYLKDLVRVDPTVLAFYQAHPHGDWGVGADAVSALDAWGVGYPGFHGLRVAPGSYPGMGYTPAGEADTGGSIKLHFPDGNATVARLLVRRLIPQAVPGASVEDVVTARVNYALLDHADHAVRLRLNSIVLRAENVGGAQHSTGVAVSYLRDGRAVRVRGRRCVLACYNMMIPYLCPELPDTQKQALHALVKTPLVYTSVAISNWRAFARLGVWHIRAPGAYHSTVKLNPSVDIGAYRTPRSPDEPSLIWMERIPCQPGLPEHEQNRVGRAELLATPFTTFERHIREQLGRMLGAGGFDPAADITAITVNRWPHGYAPEFNSLFDPELPASELPHVLGRARCGQITIANSDSGDGAYTDVAIEQAHRAVYELLAA